MPAEDRPTAARQPTIWQALAAKLGRAPTHREACDEVARIIREVNLALRRRP